MGHKLDYTKGKAGFVMANGGSAWHGLGKTFDGDITTVQALEHAGLDFIVSKAPNIHVLPDLTEIVSDSSFFTFRTDKNDLGEIKYNILGSGLGAKYEVLQNIECFDLTDQILQHGKAKIETAGSIDGGRKVFICLRVNDGIRVGDSDLINQYVLLSNSHDGSMSIRATPTNVRVVCNNTLTAALNRAKGSIAIRHTANAGDKIKEAAKVLGLISHNTQINTDNYNRMKEIEISKQQMFDYFGSVFLDEKEIKELQKGEKLQDVASKQKQNTLAGVLDFALHGVGQSMAMNGSTFNTWSAYNAVTGYLARKKYDSPDQRANNLLFGTGAGIIQDAGVLALAPEKIQKMTKTGGGLMSGFSLN